MPYKLLYRLNYLIATMLLIIPLWDKYNKIPNTYFGIGVFTSCFLIAFYLKILEAKEFLTYTSIANISIRIIGKMIVVGLILFTIMALYNSTSFNNLNSQLNSPIERALANGYSRIAIAIPKILGYYLMHVLFCLIVGIIAMIPALALSPIIMRIGGQKNNKL